MNLARVVGNVWATRKDENFTGAKLMLLQPIDEQGQSVGAVLAAADTVGCGPGETVFYVTAREAIIALKEDVNHLTPCDAAIVGIVDFIGGREM